MAGASTALYSPPSPAPRSKAGRVGVEFFCGEAVETMPRRHSLDTCSLCRRPLGRSRDIYMYRGDIPFCSEECRQEQIDLDLAREEEEAHNRRRSRKARASLSSGPVSTTGLHPVPVVEGVVAN